MIKTISKQMTLSATSIATVSGSTGDVDVPIVFMQAQIQADGKVVISQAVQNDTVYLQNLETASKDYNEFYTKVIEMMTSNEQ